MSAVTEIAPTRELMNVRNDVPPQELEPSKGSLQAYLLAAMRCLKGARTADEWAQAINGHSENSTRLLLSDLRMRGFEIWIDKGARPHTYELEEAE